MISVEICIEASDRDRLLDSLPITAGVVGVHAFSGAGRDGTTTLESVRELVNSVREWEKKFQRG